MSKSLNKLFPIPTLIGLVFSSLIIILLHWLRADYNPLSRYISEYGIGKFGVLASIAFSVFGLSIVFLYPKIKASIPRNKISRVGEFFLLIWGLFTFSIGFFVCDPKGTPFTTHGLIHSTLASISFVAFIIASILLSKFFKYAKILKVFSYTSIFFLILFMLGFFGDKLTAYKLFVPEYILILYNFTGLTERIMILASTFWAVLVIYNLWARNHR